MKIMKFEGHPNANAYVIQYDDGEMDLVSYTTIVATVDNEGWLRVKGLYSRTTIKHISWFMRSLGLTYQLAKQLVMDEKEFNIYTGEVIDW